MSDQSQRKAPAPEQSHDRVLHPASGCSRDDRGAGWRWLKRRHRDIFLTADTFAAALSSSAQQLLEPLICRCLAVPEHQDGSARACSSPPCPSKSQPQNSQKGAETDISTLLSADILALLLQKHYADRMLWNIDRSNVCFYEIAISIRAKSAKGGSADCFDPNRSRAPTAIASLHQFAARRRTRSAPKRGGSCRTTRTRSRRGRASQYAVNLGGPDE